MRLAHLGAALALASAGLGCARAADPQRIADDTTRAVYDGDLDRTTQRFDDALKAQVTRASVGQLSDRMHALGEYQGLKPMESAPEEGRYDFAATFARGSMLVEMRLDPDRKIGAYRVVPPAQ